MKVTVIAGRELSPALRDRWRRLQQSNAALESPYFCAEFTQAIAAVRDDVEVAVIERDGDVAAFFAYQRGPGDTAVPVGGMLSDYQGVICAPHFRFAPLELLAACRLRSFDFDHLIASQSSFAPFVHGNDVSPQIDLARADAAPPRRAARKICGSTGLPGPLRFIGHSTDRRALDQVLAWKSRQYLKSGAADLFAAGWVRAAVERIHATQSAGFSGMLSLLYAGDHLVAGHFGMRAGAVLHYWFPAHDVDFAKISPGSLLLSELAGHAPSIGVRTIDLGKGMSDYKRRVMNNAVPLAVGCVEPFSAAALMKAMRRRSRGVLNGLRGAARGAVIGTRWEMPARRMLSALRSSRS